MSRSLAGAALGLVAATGALHVLGLPVRRRSALANRLAPYVGDTASARGQPGVRARAVGWLVARVDRALGGSASVRRRLDQAGLPADVERFRTEQVWWGGAGLLAGLLLVAPTAGRVAPVAALGLCALLAVVGALGRDRLLSAHVRRREERMLAELPAIAEMLALSVGAGEGMTGALERVARIARGELAVELRRVVGETRAGVPLVDALDAWAARSSLGPIARFVNGVAVAVERGTPLADVLRAQAGDVRAERRRALLDAGGRKEIAMLFPVVFLVLPVTVAFALFPGYAGLSLAVP